MDIHERMTVPEYWQDWIDDPVESLSRADPVEVVFLWFAVALLGLCWCCLPCWLREVQLKRRARRNARPKWEEGFPGEDEWDNDDVGAVDPKGADTTTKIEDDDGNGVWPAYNNGAGVEFFVSGVWAAAELRARLCHGAQGKGNEDEDLTFSDVSYVAALRNEAKKAQKASLEVLRWPLQINEPCEIFVASKGKWMPGQVELGRKTHGTMIMYHVKMQDDGDIQTHPATSLRRRFLAGASVQAYESPKRGWVHAVVLPGKQAPVKSNFPVDLYWNVVAIKIHPGTAEEEEKSVPSSLLRPHGAPYVEVLRLNNEQPGELLNERTKLSGDTAEPGTAPATATPVPGDGAGPSAAATGDESAAGPDKITETLEQPTSSWWPWG